MPFSGERLLILGVLACALLLGCTAASGDVVTQETASPRPSATMRPPARVTIEPLPPTSLAGSLGRPGAGSAIDGDLVEGTPDPGRCPDPYREADRAATAEAGGSPPATPDPERPVRLVASSDVPPPQPIAPVPLRAEPALQADIDELLGEDAARYAVVVKDLRDGRGVAINADRLFYAASLFKLEVMYEIFHQRQAGVLDFSETFVASDYYASFDLGPHLIAQCEEVTVERALMAMMSVSDNVAAVMLQDRAGARNINNAMAALGLTVTSLQPDALPATAADIALLIETIARGHLGNEATLEMLGLMANEKVDDRIPSAVPEGTLVAHKTGNWENATHDAGIVYGARSEYLVVLMSDVGFDGDAAAVQRDIMRTIWAHFEAPIE